MSVDKIREISALFAAGKITQDEMVAQIAALSGGNKATTCVEK